MRSQGVSFYSEFFVTREFRNGAVAQNRAPHRYFGFLSPIECPELQLVFPTPSKQDAPFAVFFRLIEHQVAVEAAQQDVFA